MTKLDKDGIQLKLECVAKLDKDGDGSFRMEGLMGAMEDQQKMSKTIYRV